MRTFIISLVILALCFGICLVNDLTTRYKIDTALDTLNTVTPDDADGFVRDWERISVYLNYTVRRTFLRDIADALQRLEAAAENGDEYEFDTARSALIYKMKELYRSQSFDIKTIL